MVVIRLSSVVCCLLEHELVERRSCTHTLYTGDIHASGKGGKVGLATSAGIEDELAILTIDANDTGDVATEVDLLGIGINISLGRSHLFYLVGIVGLIVIDQRIGIDCLIDIVIVGISIDILLLKLAVHTEGAADIVLVGCGIIDIRSIDGSIVAIDVLATMRELTTMRSSVTLPKSS